MKVLVLGSNGQIGRCLRDQLRTSDYDVTWWSREHCDVSVFCEVKAKIQKASPDMVINCTAYTAVDKAEEDSEAAESVNHFAVGNLASICLEQRCWLVHISTDYVFDGRSQIPYKEGGLTNPQSVYGKSKLRGEKVIQQSGCRHFILRTSWVFSEHGNNFLKTMIRLGRERNEIAVVQDQFGCPTYAQDIAKTIVNIIPKIFFRVQGGVYHYCGDVHCSWFDFACLIFDELRSRKMPAPAEVTAIATELFPTKAQRPQYSVLNCEKIEHEFSVSPSNWREGIISSIEQLN